MVRRALLAALATGCSPPPATPPVADLDIKKMPDAGASAVTPKAVADDKAFLAGGKCGGTVGQAAPPLSPGIQVGKVTIVVTWAHPALQEIEKLQRLYARHRDRVDVIAMSVDDEKAAVFAFAKQHGAAFTVAWDEDHHAAECWKVQTMPSTHIVDREGVVRHLYGGYHDGDVDEMEREIEKL